MLYIWDIERIIENELRELKLDIECEFDNKLNVPMSYNVSTNTIKFNYLQVNGYKSKIKVKETEENFVKITLYHMVGYYLDFRNTFRDLRILMYGDDKEKEELRAKIEASSWELGRTVVPEHLLESYDRVRELDQQLIKH
ncbi:hypothetical protein [Bacillus sp. Marseille-Q3570]|uniref:hypothetical protein n=1 Tax=Bacillus sp. Marseille-Q3570 TaxID=2963522 RepID=UPI0021B81FAE|nr:hypothetical protein [Bacillus sp. Marseille-Q3570]